MSGYDQERIANLQYEAGMYESLYENAKTRIAALEAALRKILADCEVDEIDPLSGSHGDIARAALAPEPDK